MAHGFGILWRTGHTESPSLNFFLWRTPLVRNRKDSDFCGAPRIHAPQILVFRLKKKTGSHGPHPPPRPTSPSMAMAAAVARMLEKPTDSLGKRRKPPDPCVGEVDELIGKAAGSSDEEAKPRAIAIEEEEASVAVPRTISGEEEEASVVMWVWPPRTASVAISSVILTHRHRSVSSTRRRWLEVEADAGA